MPESFDILVVGGGPAGQKAAIQGAKARKRVLVIEQGAQMGGECVHRGTIPSKTLRETAMALSGFRRRTAEVLELSLREDLRLASLLKRMDLVVHAHERYMSEQLRRNGIESWHGRARFVDPHEVEVLEPGGARRRARADLIVIATGSRPRATRDLPIDHENVLDSDSILSMAYLPESLTVLGGGVIACEYASIFAALGVRVTLIDKSERPMPFLDPELTERFVKEFEEAGSRFIGKAKAKTVEWDGVSSVVTTLDSDEVIRSPKMLVALGREANLAGLDLEKTGIKANARGLLEVDEHCRTAVAHIYAVGDVIGPPSLASSAMEQGRRAVRHALGLPTGASWEMFPVGIYTIPEMSCVGISEQQAIERFGGALVGRARFEELARGQIAGHQNGLLKLIAEPTGRKIVGVHIVGEGAAELIHVGQMALLYGGETDVFVENIFNFPTLAEAYRVAALDIAGQRGRAPVAVGCA